MPFRNPVAIRTVGITGGNTVSGWKYLINPSSGATTAGRSVSLKEGVQIYNAGATASAVLPVISIFGLTGGTAGTLNTDGFVLPSGQDVFFKTNDLNVIMVKTTSGTVTDGVTLSYIAY
jgi:hypothetical protein